MNETPEELRALADDASRWYMRPAALRAAADTIEDDAAERETLRATVERLEREKEACREEAWRLVHERDEAVALLRTFQNAMAECEGYPEDTNEWQDVDAFLSRLDYEERQVDVGTIAETREFLARTEGES